MAQQNSFDIVSEVDRAEITNAINQTVKEVRQRFDFKGSTATVVLEANELILTAEDHTVGLSLTAPDAESHAFEACMVTVPKGR